MSSTREASLDERLRGMQATGRPPAVCPSEEAALRPPETAVNTKAVHARVPVATTGDPSARAYRPLPFPVLRGTVALLIEKAITVCESGDRLSSWTVTFLR